RAGLLPPLALPLDEPAGREGRARAAVRQHLAQPRLGHDRILVSAEHVLENLRPLDHAPRWLADVRLGELGRVARALAEDPGAVELVVRGRRPELVGHGAQAPELFARELAQRDLASPHPRAATGGLELVQQGVVAVAPQRVDGDRLSCLAFLPEPLQEWGGCGALRLVEAVDLGP